LPRPGSEGPVASARQLSSTSRTAAQTQVRSYIAATAFAHAPVATAHPVAYNNTRPTPLSQAPAGNPGKPSTPIPTGGTDFDSRH